MCRNVVRYITTAKQLACHFRFQWCCQCRHQRRIWSNDSRLSPLRLCFVKRCITQLRIYFDGKLLKSAMLIDDRFISRKYITLLSHVCWQCHCDDQAHAAIAQIFTVPIWHQPPFACWKCCADAIGGVGWVGLLKVKRKRLKAASIFDRSVIITGIVGQYWHRQSRWFSAVLCWLNVGLQIASVCKKSMVKHKQYYASEETQKANIKRWG